MEPRGLQDRSESLPDKATDKGLQWVSLCDEFVNLEGQCAVLCELLSCVSRREHPLEPAGRHGVDMVVSQLRERTTAFKQQLYKMHPDQ